jgi:major membrane immunogen (membrane-anchored lipoprotein)
MKKFLGLTIALLAIVTLTACGSSETKTATSESTTTEVKAKNVLQDFKDAFTMGEMDDLKSATVKGDTLTLTFDYDSSTGNYFKGIRSAASPDKRLVKLFKELNVKKVELKTDAGGINLAGDYGVKFIY